MASKFGTYLLNKWNWFWAEVNKAYKTVKSFVIQFFTLFKDKDGKVSSKRVWASIAFAIAVRELFIKDYWGALGAVITGAILSIIAAITKS